MARKLAQLRGEQQSKSPDRKTDEDGDKVLLNRREYVWLGTAVAAAVFGSGAGMVAANKGTDSFTTDFSGYA